MHMSHLRRVERAHIKINFYLSNEYFPWLIWLKNVQLYNSNLFYWLMLNFERKMILYSAKMLTATQYAKLNVKYVQ